MNAYSHVVWTVGHDGSDAASRAVGWTLHQAVGRDVRVVVVRSWDITGVDFPLPGESIRDLAPSTVSDDIDEVVAATRDVGVPVSTHIVRGAAAGVLLDASERGELLVVGSRGQGGFRRLLLGSVSSQCATHARVPTIVVPPPTLIDRRVDRIVVGLDGSARSRRALTWATEFAADACEITVVGAWKPSRSSGDVAVQPDDDESAQARDRFHQVLDEVEVDHRSGPFRRRFEYGDPATTLLAAAAAEDADLLVVGQRGHSGLSAAVLGSVTTHVLHHSPVPVAVAPGGADEADEEVS